MTTSTARGVRASTLPTDTAGFSFSSGALYADKDEYLSKGLTFTINSIEFQEKAGFENSDRWSINVTVDDGREDEVITLQSNERRDAELETALAHLTKHGPIRNVKLVKSGKAYYFRSADAKSA